ncbi:NEL-type E3 ubiquitin ligase domain-containing protein [Edwardsiella ictaluri]|uniref:NEL-type E3 ubiquitin ligase domain-containing protein n=1 Tax=Edwardsiella ictaluri TaxID=67780 RepID=UPI0021D82838|nr:NEL-type E3 ubiquitin ligase domain-containing protein [Edwardsiella ictaluri]UYB62782.1 NEL-type E3 ubiquitin ligase domain-containing protein [Edwardsiella ictaluri]
MPLHVGTGHIPATISNNRIHRIASANTPPEMSVRENIQEFFCSTHKSEALNCLWEICHPPVGTTRDAVAGRFEQLKRLAYPGYENNIQSGRNGDNSFCILDEDGQEMLSVILGDADTYTVIYPGGEMTHDLSLSAPQGDEGLLILGASDTVGPQTEGEYKAAWSAWERAAPPEEAEDRAKTVRELRHCLRYNTRLDVSNTKLTSLPPLPTGLKRLDVSGTGLTSLPPLPSKLQRLDISNTPMPRLPSLPSRLQRLDVSNTSLTSLPELPTGLESLDISHTSLTSLPELPTGLQWLYISHTSLTSLPELPTGLEGLDISNSSLTSLPELPSELRSLNISNTSLTSLPELPSELRSLNISNTSLTSLPELPSELRSLNISNTSLTSLPELPSELRGLNISNTSLTSLPPLPSKLQRLDISNTPMPRLPSLPSRLQRLDVSNTHLANLPEIIANLSQRTTVRLQSNSLSERTLQMINKPGYQGPRIVDMATSSNHQETRALHLAVADWLTPAEADEEASAKRWWAIGKEDDAAAFSTFLDRLKKTKNNQATDFHVQIASWISQLAQDDELRAKTFDMATESTSSCEDRVTLAMNNMKSVQLVHNAEKGKFDHDIPGLVSAGREMFRLEQLDLIAREKVKKLRFFDEIEVFLGYQNKLKESLELTGTTEGMQFFGASRITELDLKAAEIQVKSAENSQFREWILQWEPLHGVLKRRESKQWQTLIDKKMEDYEREYQQLSDTELKPAGLLGDIEAERTIGARAMASAEKAFQQGLHPLAEQLLGRHLGPRWSLAEYSVYHSLA